MTKPTDSGWYWYRDNPEARWTPTWAEVEPGGRILLNNCRPATGCGEWGPPIPVPVSGKCAKCGVDVVGLADEAPICADCLDKAPPEEDLQPAELFTIVDMPTPIADAEDRKLRLDAYRRWLDDPDLERPPGPVVGEAATAELALEHAPRSALVVVTRQGQSVPFAVVIKMKDVPDLIDPMGCLADLFP